VWDHALVSRKPRATGPFHVVTTRRQGKHREYVAHLLRRSYREGGLVKKETVANLSHLPDEVVELIRGALRGKQFVLAEEALAVERSLPGRPRGGGTGDGPPARAAASARPRTLS